MIPLLLKCSQRYVMFSSNADRRRGHRCSQYKWSNPKLCNPLFEAVFEDPICLFENVLLWESRNPEVWAMLHRHVLNICRHTLTYTHRVIYALSAASRFRDQALLSNDMGVEKLNEAERWSLITEYSRVHWCTASQTAVKTHLIRVEGSFWWHGRRAELYTCVNSDMFFTIFTFLLEFHLKSPSFYCGSVFLWIVS